MPTSLDQIESRIIRVTNNEKLLAIILPAGFISDGTVFFTDNNLSQQLAYMHHPAGKEIAPHSHNPVLRQVHNTEEVLVIRRGRLRVDFYDDLNAYIHSRVLHPGDVILLIEGGHGFEALDDLEMIEIKQGPYVGESEKTRFAGIHASEACIQT